MAGRKLTNDQKREQRKRKQARLDRKREHERNREFNQFSDLMRIVSLAAEGEADLSQVHAMVLEFTNGKAGAGAPGAPISTQRRGRRCAQRPLRLSDSCNVTWICSDLR